MALFSADESSDDTFQQYYSIKCVILDKDIDSAEANRSVKRLRKLLELKASLIGKAHELSRPPAIVAVPQFGLSASISNLLEKVQKIADEKLINEVQLDRVKEDFTTRPTRCRSEVAQQPRISQSTMSIEKFSEQVISIQEKIDGCIVLCKKEFRQYDACQRVKGELEFTLAVLKRTPIISKYKEPGTATMQNFIAKMQSKTGNAPFKITSEESMLHTSVASDPTLGIIIYVKDEPALVWGQSFKKEVVGIPYEEDNIDDDDDGEDFKDSLSGSIKSFVLFLPHFIFI